MAAAASSSGPRPTKHLTLLLLHDTDRQRVLLGLKKRGFGENKYNGFGGKLEPGETVLAAALREMHEESGVHAVDARLVGEIVFEFVGEEAVMRVHVFCANRWTGEVAETAEMAPRWFPADAVPYSSMWLDDKHWLPLLLRGQCFRARFLFRGHEAIDEMEIEEVAGETFAGAELNVPVPANAPFQTGIVPSFGKTSC
jgi:8-oxo-dGTP diphosphatase/2-hydroxy-dATP diphosphatase